MNEALGLKIYGLTKVGAKGQVILPKECREDFHASVGGDYELVMIDDKTFGIGPLGPHSKIERMLQDFRKVESCGSVRLGTKYQFVIPSHIRKQLHIQTGDNLLVLGKEQGLGFVQNNNLEFLFEYLKRLFIHAS